MTRFGKRLRFLWTERHSDEFPHPADFNEYRNRIGGLLLDLTSPRLTFVVAGAGGLLVTLATARALRRAAHSRADRMLRGQGTAGRARSQ